MLYGRTNANQLWEVKNVTSEPAILYSENSRVIAIPGLLENLKEKSDTGLFFYVFGYRKKERFVLVTTKKVDFLALNNPANMVYSGICMYVKGALWDLECHKFVDFNGPEGYFHNFMLYDAGIPNIVFDNEKKQYTIFTIKEEQYCFYANKAHYQPTVVSHMWKNNKVGRPVNNRLIFVTYEDGEDENMLVLNEEIGFDAIYDGVSFVESIPLNMESDSDESFFRSVHGKDAIGHEIEDAEVYNVKHLVFDDAIIVEEPYEEYSVVFVENGRFVFDESFDCVDYEKVIRYDESGNEITCKENVIKVKYKINDFENREAVFNITTGKVS